MHSEGEKFKITIQAMKNSNLKFKIHTLSVSKIATERYIWKDCINVILRLHVSKKKKEELCIKH
jgi:hypothetical protein